MLHHHSDEVLQTAGSWHCLEVLGENSFCRDMYVFEAALDEGFHRRALSLTAELSSNSLQHLRF